MKKFRKVYIAQIDKTPQMKYIIYIYFYKNKKLSIFPFSPEAIIPTCK